MASKKDLKKLEEQIKKAQQKAKAKSQKEKKGKSKSSSLSNLPKIAPEPTERTPFSERFKEDTKEIGIKKPSIPKANREKEVDNRRINPLIKTPTRMQGDTSPEIDNFAESLVRKGAQGFEGALVGHSDRRNMKEAESYLSGDYKKRFQPGVKTGLRMRVDDPTLVGRAEEQARKEGFKNLEDWEINKADEAIRRNDDYYERKAELDAAIEEQDYNKLVKWMPDAAEVIGSMIPTMAVGAATGGVGGMAGLTGRAMAALQHVFTGGEIAGRVSGQEARMIYDAVLDQKGARELNIDDYRDAIMKANTTGELVGIAEAATEMLFGGIAFMGKGILDHTIGKIGFEMLSPATKASITAWRNTTSGRISTMVAQRLGGAMGEGMEEAIMSIAQPAIERNVAGVDSEFSIDEMIRDFGMGAAVSMILGMPVTMADTAVVAEGEIGRSRMQKELQELVSRKARELAGSGEITVEDAANINAQVEDLRRGKGSLAQSEAVEEVKVTEDNLDAVYANHDEAREAMMAEAKTKKDGEKIAARYIDKDGNVQLWQTHAKGGRITDVVGGITTESEKAKYTAKAQKVASAANATERTGYQLNVREDIIKEVSVISKAINREVEFIYDNNSAVHGYVKGDKIYVNANSSQSPARAVIAHEMTHMMENTMSYSTLRDMVYRFYGNSVADKRAEIISNYSAAGVKLSEKKNAQGYDEVDTELMAFFVEEKLLTDAESIKQVVKQDRTLAEKIVEFINKVIQKITGSREQKFLIEARDVWNKALQEEKSGAKQNNVETEDIAKKVKKRSPKVEAQDRRYSIADTFVPELEKWDEKGRPSNKRLFVGTVSDALKSIGIGENMDTDPKIYWYTTKLKKILEDHSEIELDTIKTLPNVLENPVIILENPKKVKRIVMFGEVYGTNEIPVMVVLELSRKEKNDLLIDEMFVVSSYARGSDKREGDETELKNHGIKKTQQIIDTYNLLYTDPNKKRTDDWMAVNRLQLPLGFTQYGSVGRISYIEKDVKGKIVVEDEAPTKTAMQIEMERAMSAKNTRNSIGAFKDSEYMDAVNRGDMTTAQRMVDEAAKAAGYSNRMYHGAKGGGGFTVFRGWQYFTENKDYAERYANRNAPESLYSVYVKMEKPFDTRDDEAREIFYDMFNEYGLTELQEDGLPDWTDGYDITDYIEENDLDYDSVLLNEGGDPINGTRSDGLGGGEFVSRGTSYVIRDSAQIKSADPVTYDDEGNVIPLSERFNVEKDDIRWSVGRPTKTELNELIKSHGAAMREVFHNRKRADHKELWDMIKDEVNHVVQTGAARRSVVDDIVRLAYETGYVNNVVEQEELGENTWGRGIYIPEEYRGEMASLGGLRSINGQLRNSGLFLTYNRTKKGTDERYGGLDEAYEALMETNPILPETTDPAEQVESLIELFSKRSDRRTLEELDEEAYTMGEENAPYLTSIRNAVEEAMDDIATFARWQMVQESREEGIQEGIKRGKKAGVTEARKKQNRLDEATMREFDKLNKQLTVDERRDAEATMKMHDRIVREVYNDAKALSAKEKEAIRKKAKAQKDEIIKQRDIIAKELKNERKNARMTLNEALKQEEKNRKAAERKNDSDQTKRQKEIDNERRKERITVAVQEYKQNKKKTTPGSDEYLFFKNKDARKVADEYRRNVIGYLVKHGQFVETNGEVVLDENGMEIASRNQKTGEWDISKRRNTYTPPWGLTLLAQKEGMDRDLFYTVYSKIAEMKTERDEKGNHVYKVKDIVRYIGMLDLGVKEKDFLYFDVARLPYSKKPTFLKGGAIKEKSGNKRGRMIEALDNISIDMFIGATKESEIYDAEKRITVKDLLDFADIVYGKEDSNGKDEFLNFLIPHTIIYTDEMIKTRMYANLLVDKPQNTDSTKTRIIRMYRDFKKNALAEGEAFERMADKLKNPLLKARYYDAKKALAVANEMIVGDHQRNLSGKKVGKSLQDIFKPVLDADKKAKNNKMMQELTELVNCRHDIYRLQVEKGYTGHSIRECEKIVDRISKEHPELLKVADEIAEYSRNLLRMCVDCGRISQAEYNYFQEKYPYYVPTFRVLENKTYDRNGNIVKRNVNVIKTAVGGYDDVLPLFDQLVRRTQEIVKVCKKNQLATEIAKSFQIAEGAEFIDEVIKTKDRKAREGIEVTNEETEDKVDFLGTSDSVEENIIPWYSAGEQYDIFVSDEHLLYGWDRILPKWSEEGWKVVLRRLNAFKRAVLTQYNPTFWIRNHIKDTHDLFLYNQHAQRLPKYYLKAWEMLAGSAVNTKGRKEVKKDALNEYLSLGMSMTSIFEYDQTNPARKMKRNKAKKIAMKPFDAIDNLNFVVEQVPRLAVYMETKDRLMEERSKGKNTYTDEEIRSIAGYQASDATLNFGRSGTIVKNLNTYGCTFLNAGVQGMDRARRAVTQVKDGNKKVLYVNILGLVFKAGLVGIGSGWIFDWLYGGDDEYAEAIREKLYGEDAEKVMREYAEMADYQRLNYILLKIDGKWCRIPRGRLASFIYSFDYNGEKLRNGEMDFFDFLVAQAEMASDTILPPNPVNENILSAFLDVQKNRDAWGEPIVEDYEDKGKGFHYLEYDDSTSDLAIAIANFGNKITADKNTGASRILDFSPKKLDYTIEQIFGSWHDFIRPFMDKDMDFADAKDSVIGLAKQFYIDPTISNRLAGDYYDLKEEFENVANANDNDSPYAVAYKVFDDYGEPLKALREEIKAIDADTSLDKEDKLSQISELRSQMNELYRQGIADAKNALAFAMENYYGAEENSDTYKEWEKLTKGAEWQISNLSDSGQAKWKAAEEAGVDPDTFIDAYNFIENASADKDENGNSIRGSKKAKITKHLNSLDLTAEQKLKLYFELGEYSSNGDIPAFSNGSVGQSGLSANMASPVAGGGRISSGYGYRNTGIPGASTYHQAVDIAAPAGTDVGASLTGTVTRVSSSGGYGNSVEITSTDENGNTIVTKYSHLLNFGVEVGDIVSQGTKIGEVGSTGVSSGAHLDFKLGINGEWVDPIQYVDLAGAGIVDGRNYTQKTGTGGNPAIGGGSRGGSSGGSSHKSTGVASTARAETSYDSVRKIGNSGGSTRGYTLPTASQITGRSTKSAGYGSAGITLPKASDYGRAGTIQSSVATTKRTGRTGGSLWDPNVLS